MYSLSPSNPPLACYRSRAGRGLLQFCRASECTLNVSIDSGDLHIFTVKSLGLTGAVSAFARVAGLEGSQVAARVMSIVVSKQALACVM